MNAIMLQKIKELYAVRGLYFVLRPYDNVVEPRMFMKTNKIAEITRMFWKIRELFAVRDCFLGKQTR